MRVLEPNIGTPMAHYSASVFVVFVTLNQEEEKMLTKKCWCCSGQMEYNYDLGFFVCHGCGATWNNVKKVATRTGQQAAYDKAREENTSRWNTD